MSKNSQVKRRAVLFLTATAFSAVLGGSLFMATASAQAEPLDTVELVSFSEGCSVQAGGKYISKAGQEIGPAGLYVRAPQDKNTSYEVSLNGIFTGSAAMKIHFPGEGFWQFDKEVIIEVASVSVPESVFQIHMGGQWQQYGYVTYNYEGTTLYRTANSWADNGTYYYTEGAVKNTGSAQYKPWFGNYQADGTDSEAGLIGLEAQADGSFDVVLTSGHSNVRKVVASFDTEPADFVPTTDTEGQTSNLPKLDLGDGYTINLYISDTNSSDSFDVQFESLAVSDQGDPYAEGGTVYALDGNTISETPDFYTEWREYPFITIDDVNFNNIYKGAKIVIPDASWISGASPVPSPVEDIVIKTPDGQSEKTNAGAEYELKQSGTYELIYTQGKVSQSYSFTVTENATYSSENAVSASGAVGISREADAKGYKGITVLADDEHKQYSGNIAGTFKGNLDIRFAFPYAGTGTGAEFAYIIRNLEGKEVFRVVWRNSDWYTGVYVRYGDQTRTATLDGSGDGWSGKGVKWYNVFPGGDQFLARPSLGPENAPEAGWLKLNWQGDVLSVVVSYRNGSEQTIAEFDGSVPADGNYNSGMIAEADKPEAGGERLPWQLPKIQEELADGYTVGFACETDMQAISVTFISINGVNLSDAYLVPEAYTEDETSVALTSYYYDEEKQAYYVPQNQPITSIQTGSLVYLVGDENSEQSWAAYNYVDYSCNFTEEVKEVGENTVSGTFGGVDVSIKIIVEESYRISFDAQGGTFDGETPVLTWSEHYKVLASELPVNISREEFRFSGWYFDEDCSNAYSDVSEAVIGNFTLYAKWTDSVAPVISWAEGTEFAENISKGEEAEVSVYNISFTDGTKDYSDPENPVPAPNAALETNVYIGYSYNGGEYREYTTPELVFTQEGTYTFLYYMVDDAGNKSNELKRNVTLGHGWSEWSMVGEDGHERTCANCGLVEKEEHVYGDKVTVSPSCTEKGYDEEICTVCGYSHKDAYTDAVGHEYGEAVTVEPDYAAREDGYVYRPCIHEGCNDIEITETIPYASYGETVTFDTDGGSKVDSIAKAAGEGVTLTEAEISVPEKQGYIFEGWFMDEACTTAVTFPYTITAGKNTVFYAKWSPVVTYTVQVTGGTLRGFGTSATLEEGTTATVVARSPEEGKIFKGWRDGETIVSNETTYSFTVEKDIELVAVYEDEGIEKAPDAPEEKGCGSSLASGLIGCIGLLAVIEGFLFRKKNS